MQTKYLLSQNDVPTRWYNVLPDLPVPLPPTLNPATLQPVGAEDLSAIFPKDLIEQEVSQDRFIDIPAEVREVLQLWRPTPLIRASRLEQAIGTPARIFFKYEGVSPTGSHKPNTAVAQVFYNKIAGIKHLTTETGAGQWGASLAMACSFFDMACQIFMVRVSYEQKPGRRTLMKMFGADVFASPSNQTAAGRALLAQDPNSPGSLGMAISEAVEIAAQNPDVNYALGSVLNHVLLHQTVIGEEALMQLEQAGVEADVVIGCVGGGSNFGGIALPFYRRNVLDGTHTRLVGVEPMACPTLTKGVYAYDYGDTAKMAPVVKMKTLGHNFMPAGIHAGGLRYHGVSPILALLQEHDAMSAVAYYQTAVFEAAALFTRTEGIIPAPESAHAIRAAIDQALEAKEKQDERVIVFALSGHGFLDTSAYDSYLAGNLQDYAYPEESIRQSLEALPQIAN
ncbi:MAG: TrpB-like pyridoxal phosphate-dependent enzyme [Anaerolineae bacterium]|jgi:tryptophan synthase beta chain|nr:TrpB-like pyridoxal phosphate-dependent enzyme [Chloroflexota bacterium]